MESLFSLYFSMGRDHILATGAYDHIAFVVALCALYRVSDWKKILILVTAFTIGHSFTLLAAAMRWLTPNYEVVEKLIPVTIMLTAIWNVSQVSRTRGFVENAQNWWDSTHKTHYFSALVFGLVHGLAFSDEFIATEPKSAVAALVSFNLGIEVGQLVVVAAMLAAAYLVMDVLKAPQRAWTYTVSLIAFGIGVYMLVP